MSENMDGREAVKRIADHDAAIKELQERGATEAEFAERIDKMETDVTDAMKALGELTKKPVEPTGPTVNASFIPKKYHGDREKAHKYLVGCNAEDGSDLAEYQRLSDAMAIAMSGIVPTPQGKRLQDRILQSPAAEKWRGLHNGLTKAALDTTSESEWVPAEILSAQMVDKVRDAARIAPLFPRIPMPTKTFKLPLLTADASGYLVAEATVAPDDSGAARITSSQPTAAQATFGAIKLACRIVSSTEMLEDMTPDSANFLTAQVAQVMADIIDDAIINGDAEQSAHMDSNVTSLTDRRHAWTGLRAMALDNSYTTSASSWPTSTAASAYLLTGRASMGKYGGFSASTGGGVAVICSYASYSSMLKDVNIQTVDKFGPAATIVTGEVARVQGVPVVVTEWLAANLNSSGVYDGSTITKTGVLLVNRGSFGLGDRRSITIKSSDTLLMEYDQVLSVGTWRGDFEDIYPIASNETVHYLYNITS
jgi:HK97 family phage major capsid protein